MTVPRCHVACTDSCLQFLDLYRLKSSSNGNKIIQERRFRESRVGKFLLGISGLSHIIDNCGMNVSKWHEIYVSTGSQIYFFLLRVLRLARAYKPTEWKIFDWKSFV